MSLGYSPRRRAALWDITISTFGFAFAIVRNILMIPLFLALIDHEQYGAWVALSGLLAALPMMDLGIPSVVGQRVVAAAGRGEGREVSGLIGTGLVLTFLIAVAVTTAAVILVPFILSPFGLTGNDYDVSIYCISLAAMVSFQCIYSLSHQCQKALQRPLPGGVVAILSELFSITLTVLLVWKYSYGLWGLTYGFVLRAFILVSGGILTLHWTLRGVSLKATFDRSLIPALTHTSKYLFVRQVSDQLKVGMPAYLIGTFLGPTEAIIFNVTTRAGETVRIMVAQVPMALTYPLGHLRGAGSQEKFVSISEFLISFQSLLGAIAAGILWGLNGPFLALWLSDGQKYYAGSSFNQVYCLTIFLAAVQLAIAQVCFAAGGSRILGSAALLEAVLLPLSLLVGLALKGSIVIVPACMVLSGFVAVSLLYITIDLRQRLVRLPLALLAIHLTTAAMVGTILKDLPIQTFGQLLLACALGVAISLIVALLLERVLLGTNLVARLGIIRRS